MITAHVIAVPDGAGHVTRGYTLHVDVGDTIVVRVVDIPTCGYLWSASAVVGAGLVAQPSRREVARGVGGQGTYVFEYAVVAAGNASVAFSQRRPWEAATVVARATVRVDVAAAEQSARRDTLARIGGGS